MISEVPGSAVNVPPHVLVALLGVPISKPGGSTSIRLTPNRERVVLLLEITNFTLVVPVTETGFGCRKDLTIPGGEITVNVSELAAPDPPSTDVTGPVEFTKVPPVADVTSTVMVHICVAFCVTPVRLTKTAPGGAVNIPPQLLVALAGVATTRPKGMRGNTSVKLMPDRVVVAFGLVILNVIVETAPGRMELGVNVFRIIGGPTTKSVEVPLPPPAVDVMLAVLRIDPKTVPVTGIVTLQEPPAAKVRIVMLISGGGGGFIPIGATRQFVTRGPVATRPGGKVSVNVTFVIGAGFGFVMTKDKVVGPFSGMVLGVNDFVNMGGINTNKVAVAGSPGPPSIEPIVLVRLFFAPNEVPATVTEKVQVWLGSNFARVKEIVFAVVVN